MLADVLSFWPLFDWAIKKGFVTQEELNELLAGGTYSIILFLQQQKR